MKKHFDELDSLRGLAAISVLFSHLLLVLPIIENNTYGDKKLWLVNLLKYTPIHIFWSGLEPVLLFFILSGFVLSLSFYGENKPSYSQFIVKRFFRLYFPYIVAVFFAVLMKLFFYKGKIEGISNWASTRWDSKITIVSLLEHISFISSFKNYALDPVLWSLVYEMRVSIVFPLLMLAIIKFNWKTCIITSIALSLLGYLLHNILTHIGYYADYFDTLRYIFVFVIGALLAKHRTYLVNRTMNLSKKNQFIVVIVAITLLTFRFWCFPINNLIHTYIIDYIVVSAGAAMFIIFALSFGQLSSFLTILPISFLGKISYSLYLYHGIILLTLINALYGILNLWVIWFLTLVISILTSYVSYVLVEVPSIKLAKKRINNNKNLIINYIKTDG